MNAVCGAKFYVVKFIFVSLSLTGWVWWRF